MRLLIDMNLSPTWVGALAARGIEAVHWSTIGDPRATDEEIMAYGRVEGYVVFTHDLDFGTLLATTRAKGPSVLQVRTQNVLPEAIVDVVVRVLQAHQSAIETGALLTVDERNSRVRILPIL